jgi:DNA-binding NarL/FixJ family response regulator
VADCLAACMLRLDQGGIDLVLLDLGLSDSQGLDTLTSVAHTHPAMPVVALTGLDDDALALRTVQAGGQDYLTKNTVTPEILRRTIRHAFERKRVEFQIKTALEALTRGEFSSLAGRLAAGGACCDSQRQDHLRQQSISGHLWL